MKFTDEPAEPLPRPERPLGVSLLTILDGLLAGFMPALAAITQIASDANPDQGDITLTTLCLSVGLPVTIITAAIGTFAGSDRARVALLILITLFFGLEAFRNVSLAAAGLVPEGQQFSAYGRALRAAVWIAINAWYFLRPGTVAFYRRPLKPAQ
jgi:hypothetical protein